MRILAGEHRGRLLRTPPGEGTRPMLARVREAMFGTLAEHVPDAQVLDLFAGSGSLSFEALSRGAAQARLIEKDRRVQEVLSQNVEALRLGDRVELVRADALARHSWGAERGAWADLVFLDPPYPWLRDTRRARLFETLELILRGALRSDGAAVLHAPRRALAEHDFPAGSDPRERTYGTSSLWYLSRPADAPEVAPEVAPERAPEVAPERTTEDSA